MKENIVRTYQEYVRAFGTLSPKAVVPYYHLPFMAVSPTEVRVLSTAAEVEERFAANMAFYKKHDYAQTKILDIYIKIMSDGLALVSTALERFTAKGEKIGGKDAVYTFTYTFRRVEGQWKIVVAMAHDPKTLLRFE